MESNYKGKANRLLGHNVERYYARVFRYLGFNKTKTSRQASRLHDDSGIDLVFIPFNVQIKAGVQKGINYSKELNIIKERIIENFPKEERLHEFPNIIIHRKNKEDKKRNEYDDLVIMSFKDFVKICNMPLNLIEYEDYNKL